MRDPYPGRISPKHTSSIPQFSGDLRPTSGWFERAIAGLLLAAYKRRLRAVVAVAPAWVVEEILSASEQIGSDRPMWMSDN